MEYLQSSISAVTVTDLSSSCTSDQNLYTPAHNDLKKQNEGGRETKSSRDECSINCCLDKQPTQSEEFSSKCCSINTDQRHQQLTHTVLLLPQVSVLTVEQHLTGNY